MRWSVQRKIVAGFVGILLLMAVFGWINYDRMSLIQDKNERITSQWMQGVDTINQLSYRMEHMLTLTFRHVFAEEGTDLPALEQEIHENHEMIRDQFVRYERLISDEEERQQFEALTLSWDQIEDNNLNTLENSGQGASNRIIARTMLLEDLKAFEEIQPKLEFLLNYSNQGASLAKKDAQDAFTQASVLSLSVFVIALLVVAGIAWLVAIMISRPLKRVTANIIRVAEGDLTVPHVHVKNKDEIGDLAEATNEMVEHLTALINEVRAATDHVAASSQELTTTAAHTADSVTEAAKSVQGMSEQADAQYRGAADSSRAMEEMSLGIQRIAEYTVRATHSSEHTEAKAVLGEDRVRDTEQHMAQIDRAVSHMSSIMDEMKSHTSEIGQINEVITDIATQTNLLSLNASIEAARAGEHGRGFAVVAQEVKKLAEQSVRSAGKVAELVGQIRKVADLADEAMKSSTEKVAHGITAVHETGRSFQDIAVGISEVDKVIHDIAAIADELSASSEEVAATAETVAGTARESASIALLLSDGTREQLTSIEQVSTAASSLTEAAKELQHSISRFKVIRST